MPVSAHPIQEQVFRFAPGAEDDQIRQVVSIEPIAGPLRAVLDAPIVIKNTVHRYQETPSISRRRRRHCWTIGFTRRVVGDIASRCRLRTAAMGRDTCANQRPHSALQ